MSGIAILEAPSALGRLPEHRGVELAPRRLLEEGIAEGLGAVEAGRVEVPGYAAGRDAETGVMDGGPLAEYSSRLADAVGEVADAERFGLVLGGDASILRGTMLGLRRRGRYGLLYIDGRADFSPLVEPRDAVVFANRDGAERRDGGRGLPDEVGVIGRERVATLGVEPAMAEALSLLERGGEEALDGFWIHVGAGVLDEAIMGAVDDPMPDGLMWGELAAAVGMAIGSGGAVGMQVANYNPDLDETGANGRGLARTINTVLTEFT